MSNPDSMSEEVIGNLLRVGVIVSAAVFRLEGLGYLYFHGDDPPDVRRTFKEMPAEFSRPKAIIAAVLFGRGDKEHPAITFGDGRGRALIALGLLLLIATPVMRVAFSIFTFARQRD